jgi:hypothetical protein
LEDKLKHKLSFIVFFTIITIFSCEKKTEKNNIETILEEQNLSIDYNIQEEEDISVDYDFLPGLGTPSEHRILVMNFVFDEILDKNIYNGSDEDKDGVVNTYGKPIKDEIIEYSDGLRYEGGMTLKGIREIIYEDLTHRYYVFINRSGDERQFYMDVLVDTKLDRLKTINIGDTTENVIEIFGNNYYRKEDEDIIYLVDDIKLLRFYIIENKIIKIAYIITRWD